MKISKLISSFILILSTNIFAAAPVDISSIAKGKISAQIGTFAYGNGAMLVITGKSALELFNKLNFEGSSEVLNSGTSAKNESEIKQTENLQCVKEAKKVTCKMFIRQNGTAGEMPLLYQ